MRKWSVTIRSLIAGQYKYQIKTNHNGGHKHDGLFVNAQYQLWGAAGCWTVQLYTSGEESACIDGLADCQQHDECHLFLEHTIRHIYTTLVSEAFNRHVYRCIEHFTPERKWNQSSCNTQLFTLLKTNIDAMARINEQSFRNDLHLDNFNSNMI